MDGEETRLDLAGVTWNDGLWEYNSGWKHFLGNDRITIVDTAVCKGNWYSANVAALNTVKFIEYFVKFANIFCFQYLTASEIHAVMSSGFATVSGTVLAAYISYGAEPAHLITSSVMAAPGNLAFSKLFYPETEESKTTAENIAIEKS